MGPAFSFIQDQGVTGRRARAQLPAQGGAPTSHLDRHESPFPSAALSEFLKLGGPAQASFLSGSSGPTPHFSLLQVEVWVSQLFPQRGVASKLPRREGSDPADHCGPPHSVWGLCQAGREGPELKR